MVGVIQQNKEKEMESSNNSYSTFDFGKKHFKNEKKSEFLCKFTSTVYFCLQAS